MKLSGKKTVAGQYSEEPFGTEGAISPIRDRISQVKDRVISHMWLVTLFCVKKNINFIIQEDSSWTDEPLYMKRRKH